jgi:hypothetical protein
VIYIMSLHMGTRSACIDKLRVGSTLLHATCAEQFVWVLQLSGTRQLLRVLFACTVHPSAQNRRKCGGRADSLHCLNLLSLQHRQLEQRF